MDVTSTAQFSTAVSQNPLIVLNFVADWAPQCQQVTEILSDLQKEVGEKVVVLKIEAENLPDVSRKFSIEAVPTVVFVNKGKAVDRVDGVKIADIAKKYRDHAQITGGEHSSNNGADAVDLNTRLQKLISAQPVMVFMKGEPDAPRCGFSRQIVQILQERNVKFGSFDILTDDEVRQGLKAFSNWPTYPQVYVDGKLIGGLDIIKELIENDEFDDSFPKQQPLEERLRALISKSKVMLFMKGDRSQPRCGFSRQTIELLNSKNTTYETFDILTDDEVRQGLKEFSNWPTYPQLYVNGQLIGGIDILKEMDSNDELEECLNG